MVKQDELIIARGMVFRKKPEEELEKSRWIVNLVKSSSPKDLLKFNEMILETFEFSSPASKIELSLDCEAQMRRGLYPLDGLRAGLAYQNKAKSKSMPSLRLRSFTKFSDTRYLDYLSSGLGCFKILDAELCPTEILEDLAFFLVDHPIWYSGFGWELLIDMSKTVGIRSREELIIKMNLAGFRIQES